MKTRILILTIICTCCLTGVAKATPQMGEWIMVGEERFVIHLLPLGQDSILARQVHKRLAGRISTGLYRGYVGTWRIEAGKLILEKIEEYDDDCKKLRKVDISGIFDAYREDGRIVARWFTGPILAQGGKYLDKGRNEREILYFIRKGEVKREKRIYNTLQEGSNKSYHHTMDMLFNGNGMSWQGDSTLKAEIYPNPDGTVKRVKVRREWDMEVKPGLSGEQLKAKINRLRKKRNGIKAESRFWAKRWWNKKEKRYGRHHPYTREAMACAELMEKWDVLTLDGKIQPVQVEITWGKDRSQRLNWLFYRPDNNQQDSLYTGGDIYRVDAYPLQQSPDLITRLRPHLKGAFTEHQPRGYLARWQIADGRLWLTEIRNARTGEPIPLAVLAPGNNGEPIEASWYTGTFEITKGDVLGNYYPLGDTETEEVICDIERGRVVHRAVYHNYVQAGDSVSYNLFTQALRSHDWNSYPELKNRSLHGRLTVYPRVDGVADSIKYISLFVNGDNMGGEYYHREITDPADPWIRLVHRAALVVSRWEVCFIKGKVKPLKIRFDLKDIEEEKLPASPAGKKRTHTNF